MIIDCGQCSMRDLACGECVVTHLLGTTPLTSAPQLDLVADEERALRVLHGAGLVPPLRMVVGGSDAAAS